MRMISVVVLAAVLATMASATHFLTTSQADVLALRDGQPQCSQMSHGRFGSFGPEHLAGGVVTNWVKNVVLPDGSEIAYSPCKKAALKTSKGCSSDSAYFLVQNTSTKTGETYCWVFTDVILNDKNKFATFNMPTKQDQQAKFNASYTGTEAIHGNMKAVVVTRCPEAADDERLKNVVIAGGWAEKDLIVAYYQIYDSAACPRFPYVPEGVPAGAVGAIIVCVIAFVVQMSICGYYHFTTKEDVNPMDN